MYLRIFIFLTVVLLDFNLVFPLRVIQNKVNNFEKNVIWGAGENNAEGFRIPGIVVSTKGTVLVFAEERPVYGDADPKSIVLRRSIDGGIHWSESIYIEECNGSYWAQNRDELDPLDTKDKKEVWTNICPLVDKETGRIFFFYSLSEGKVAGKNLQRYTKVFFKTSDDDGINWSGRVDITNILNSKGDGSPNRDGNGERITDKNGFLCDFLGRAFHMPGPGHGIQLSDGRLLLSVWNRTAIGILGRGGIPVTERNYGISTIYSDDHGKTWEYGSSVGHNGLNMNESRMAELANGDVYLNARYVNSNSREKNNYRMVALSHDKGETWTNIHVDKNFPLSNPCDAGLIGIKGKQKEKYLLLYSKNESPDGRKKLVIRISYDEGKSWPVAKVIDEGPALYSDLAVLPDKTILLVYETGKDSPVYCVRMNKKWLEDK